MERVLAVIGVVSLFFAYSLFMFMMGVCMSKEECGSCRFGGGEKR